MKDAAQIRELVEQAAQADPEYKIFGAGRHKFQLNPPVSIEKVRQFEEEYHIELPEEYVLFLTQVGNGGAGPYYGLFSLEELEGRNRELQEFKKKKETEPFVLIDKGLTRERWNSIVDDETEGDGSYESLIERISGGVLVIGTQGCTFDTLLMCRGSETGKLVYIDWNMEPDYPPFFTGMTFLEWYVGYFEEVIAGNDVTSYGYLRLGTEAELRSAYESANDLDEKKKIISGFYRFRKMTPQTIDFLQNIEEAGVDGMRTELLLRNSPDEGIGVFERLLDGKNPEGAVQCARRLPKSCKDKYYGRMLQLLYEENACNKGKILYYLHDCECKRAKDIVDFAADEQREEEIRRTAIFVMGCCEDASEYENYFISWMRGDLYWIAHAALQAMAKIQSPSDALRQTFLWMWDRYKNDNTMRMNLKRLI